MNENDIPVGWDFLHLIWTHDHELEDSTDKRIKELGRKAPACMNGLGTALSHLDRLASCFYGCKGGDHLIEYLTGRVYSLARSSIRLFRFGNYDESLSLTRTIGEITNLVQLFALSSADFLAWKIATKAERMSTFSPAAVRKRLEALGEPPKFDKDWYSSICELVTHPTPQTKPNAFNALGIPVAAPVMQDEGILVCLNELGKALCYYVIPAVQLLPVSKEERLSVLHEVRGLAENLGSLTLNELPTLWAYRHAGGLTKQ